MILTTKAIVLHATKFGDASLIVDMFTEQEGRVPFVVKIPRTSKGKIKKQYFQPLTVLEIVFDYRQRATLQHLKDARIVLPYVDIPFNPSKGAVLFFLSDFLYHVTRDEQQNKPLFSYIINSLDWFDKVQKHFVNFHLVFMIHVSHFIGFYPNIETYEPQSYFDLRNATFSVRTPSHSDYLSVADSNSLTNVIRMTYENMHLFRFTREERLRVTELVLRFYSIHVPSMPNLKSLQVLREVFN